MNSTLCVPKLILALGLLISSIGCATVDKHTEIPYSEGERPANRYTEKSWPFGKHHNPGVRIPARVGGAAGGILVGLPVSVGLIPVTAPIGGAINSNLFPLVPMLVCCEGGETLGGAIVWPFFGWWHLPNQTPKP